MGKILPDILQIFMDLKINMGHLDIELVPEPDTDYNPWFGTIGKNYDPYLTQFLRDGVGGHVILWIRAGSKDSEDPVVYLDSYGKISVIAENINQFLSIIATGYNLYDLVFHENLTHFEEVIIDEQELKDARERHMSLVNWLKSEFEIEPAADTLKIIRDAQKKYPDFKEWIGKKVGK